MFPYGAAVDCIMPKQPTITVTLALPLNAVDAATLDECDDTEVRTYIITTLLKILALHRHEPMLGQAKVLSVEITRVLRTAKAGLRPGKLG